MRSFIQSSWPHLAAVVVFFLVAVIYHHPVIFGNEEVRQHDMLQWEGGAQTLLEHYEETGKDGLWADNMFSGMPAYLIFVKFGWDLPNTLRQVMELGLPRPVGQTFLALLGFYILLLTFGVRSWVALIGAVAFGLNSFNLINIMAGHNGKGYAIAYMAWCVAGLQLLFRSRWWSGTALTALGFVLMFRTGHIQIIYYLLLVLLAYGLAQLVHHLRQGTLKTFGVAAALAAGAVLLAVLTVLGRLWTVYEYGQYSTRGPSDLTEETLGADAQDKAALDRDYAFDWSQGLDENFTLLVPYFRGGSTNEPVAADSEARRELSRSGQQLPRDVRLPAYWGEQVGTAGPIYAGAVVVFLFVLAWFVAPRRHVAWLVAVAVLGILMSLGKNLPGFNYFLFDHLPFYNKFRTASMAVVLPLFAMPLLGFLGLEHFLRGIASKDMLKKLYLGGGIVAGVLVLMYLMLGTFSYSGPVDRQLPPELVPVVKTFRRELLSADVLRSLFFVVVSAAALWLAAKKVLRMELVLAALGLLVVVDMWGIGRRYLNESHYERAPRRSTFRASPADEAIQAQAGGQHYRVLNLQNPWNDALTSYHHPSIGGYHGAKMKRYQELITYRLSEELPQVIDSLRAGSLNFTNANALNMLNASYLKFGDEAQQFIPNDFALGAAWVVDDVLWVDDADAALAALGTVDVASTAVVNKSKAALDEREFTGSGTVKLESKVPGSLTYQASITGGEAFAVLSEIYYPAGWKATVNGQSVPIVPTNYVLRGVVLPEGTSEVKLSFEPAAYYTSRPIMSVASVLLLLVVLGGFANAVRLSVQGEDSAA